MKFPVFIPFYNKHTIRMYFKPHAMLLIIYVPLAITNDISMFIFLNTGYFAKQVIFRTGTPQTVLRVKLLFIRLYKRFLFIQFVSFDMTV